MLLDRSGELADCSGMVLSRLPALFAQHASAETHAAVIELTTGVNRHVHGAWRELATLRRRLANELEALDLGVASAGLHPQAQAGHTRLTTGGRYSVIAASMRSLVRREPTMALHVHVGVPDPEDAVTVFNGLRPWVPVLLALSANSPFNHSGDSGFASLRTEIFQGFPRTGLPRRFVSYGDYVRAIDPLVRTRALPDPTFLWWDLRLQPRFGTVEVRVMDTQTSLGETVPLLALIQSLARLVLEGEQLPDDTGPEVLAENRFLAARDGLQARLIDENQGGLVPVRELVERAVSRCAPHAVALGCSRELERVRTLVAANGADRQRSWAGPAGDLRSVVAALAARYTAGSEPHDERSPAATEPASGSAPDRP